MAPSNNRVCGVCNKPYTGTSHNHAAETRQIGPVATPRPMVGTPPTRKRK